MRARVSVSCVCALVIVFAAAGANGQAPANGRSSASAASASYTPPKTPWGDPDLQAIWSGDSAFGIPLQRPQNLGTKAELSDEEFAKKQKTDTATRTRAENAVGSFRND